MSDMTGLGTGRAIEKTVTAVAVECVRGVRALYRRLCASRREGGLAEAIEAGPEALERALVRSGYRLGTGCTYARCVWRFLEAVGHRELRALRDDDVVAFVAYLRSIGRGNACLRLHLCAIRAVFDTLMELGITTGIRHAPRPRQRPAATREEVQAVLRACGTSGERFVVGRLTGTGIMPGQLCRLGAPEMPPAAVSGEGGSRDGTRKPHVLPFVVYEADAAGIHWLLPSPRGRGPISTRTLRRIVARLAAAAGVEVTCTALRKAGPAALRASA
ncbi:MAG: hypothetical protein JXR77_11565 [Lentisphaeria bacterium]|nr:hypothetical protein [Lentisphaeria bacterium]